MKEISLNGIWQGSYLDMNQPEEVRRPAAFRGTVPGCAHTDLLENGLIPDYMIGYQIDESRFIENCRFTYSRTFQLEQVVPHMLLSLSSLDTYSEIYLNGRLLGRTDNMFLCYRFEASDFLRVGENALRVCFTPPQERLKDAPAYPAAFSSDRVSIRRMQCTHGWDWVDRFVTMGIQGDVSLLIPSPVEISSVYISTTALDSHGAQLSVQVSFSGPSCAGAVAEQTIFSPGGELVWQHRAAVAEPCRLEYASVMKPALWYPHNMGEQPLYRHVARVYLDGVLISEKETVFGIRTVRILESPDLPGTPEARFSDEIKAYPFYRKRSGDSPSGGFLLLVNGRECLCMGANWVPCEPFPSAVEDQRLEQLLSLARHGGFNMLRVWGGGVYESDRFYEICDRLGILVAQDFMMACAHYPEQETWFMDAIREETVQAAMRLRNHASLVWWTGDNENGMKSDLRDPAYPGRFSAMQVVLPQLVRLDPHRRFLPTSPYGGKPFMSPVIGLFHNTAFMDEMFRYLEESDLSDYQEAFGKFYLSRFCNEALALGAPAESSLRRFMPGGDPYDFGAMEFHTKNNASLGGLTIYDAMLFFAEKLLGGFRNPEDQLLKLQYIQYEWVRYTMELFRRNSGYMSGIVYWMFNDCWTAAGPSMVDYYGVPKSGYYAFRQASRPVSASLAAENGRYALYVSSNAQTAYGTAKLHLQLAGADWSREVAFTAPAGAPCRVWASSDSETEMLRGALDAGSILIGDLCLDFPNGGLMRCHYFSRRICDLALPAPFYMITEPDASHVTIHAETYIHAVVLDGAYLFEDNYFSLIPGESRTIRREKLGDGGEMTVRCLEQQSRFPATPPDSKLTPVCSGKW